MMFQVEDRHQYTILAVTEADEGRYTCAAENVLGQTDLVSYLTVNTSQVRPATLDSIPGQERAFCLQKRDNFVMLR